MQRYFLYIYISYILHNAISFHSPASVQIATDFPSSALSAACKTNVFAANR